MKWQGIGVSPTLCIGKVKILEENPSEYTDTFIKPEQVDPEIARYNQAKAELSAEYKKTAEEQKLKGQLESQQIILAQHSILNDIMFAKETQQQLTANLLDAPSAVHRASVVYIQKLKMVDNPYIQERVADLKDVAQRLIAKLQGFELFNPSHLTQPTILVAKDIPPSLLNSIDPSVIKGIVCSEGSRTSHTAILAASFGIAAVMGCPNCLTIPEGSNVLVNGNKGTVLLLDSNSKIQDATQKVQAYLAAEKELAVYASKPTKTLDGTAFTLCANIMEPSCPSFLMDKNPDGVGLFRTEFLFMERETLPSEKEQFAAYAKVGNKFGQRPVIIRTMDIGGDKKAPCLGLPKEENPFLGYRGIRISLEENALFLSQLRAILRANTGGNLHIMYPMISSLSELKAAKKYCQQAKESLLAEGVEIPYTILQGIMIETPAAALEAEVLIQHCDFFSIGSNDLTQYTLAVDRMNPRVAPLYSHYHPAVLKLIALSARAAAKEGKMCGVCGQMASDPLAIPFLIGIGITELSVGVSSLLNIKKSLSQLDLSKAQGLANALLQLETSDQIVASLKKFNS